MPKGRTRAGEAGAGKRELRISSFIPVISPADGKNTTTGHFYFAAIGHYHVALTQLCINSCTATLATAILGANCGLDMGMEQASEKREGQRQ